MSYLYGEPAKESRANLEAHLLVCPECKMRVEEWSATKKELGEWRVPVRSGRVELARPILKWAIAAVIVLGVGVGLGRFAAPASADTQTIRAAIEPAIRQQLQKEFTQTLQSELDRASARITAESSNGTKQLISELAKAIEQRRTDDLQTIYAALNKIDGQRIADFASIRKDLETVAVLTDVSLRHTEQQLYQLADAAEPANFSNSPKK